MQPLVLGTLPDELLTWRGTASALADQCNALLPNVGLSGDAGCANERLVRHYVQVGILSPPDKEGREAIFNHAHVGQFLAARHLLRDRWSLGKIAELFRAAGPENLTALVPEEALPTAAERALERIRARHDSSSRDQETPPASSSDLGSWASLGEDSMSSAPPMSRAPLPASLRAAADIASRRLRLKARLTELGNTSGEAERQRVVAIRLAPWCQVYVDADALQGLSPSAIDTLGTALAEALHEERMTRGEKS